jgi:hypothetical protein
LFGTIDQKFHETLLRDESADDSRSVAPQLTGVTALEVREWLGGLRSKLA